MSVESDVKGSVRAVSECLVEECRQPAFGRVGVFCPGHSVWEADECDACGELQPSHDGVEGLGEYSRGWVHAAMIDPPDESWICDGCVARVEDAEVDRAEALKEQQYYEWK